MSESQNLADMLINCQKDDMIPISRAEIKLEHDLLVARLHQLRRWLGYPAIPTGKQERRERIR